MYCKYCGTELEKNNTVCAACGRDTADKPKRVKKKKPLTEKQMKIIVASAAGAIVAIAFVIMAICGVFTPKEGVFLKDSYSVSASDAAENADKVIATVGEIELTNAQLQVFYWMEVYDFVGANYDYLSYYGLNTAKPLSEQVSIAEDGKTWEQYFLDEAIYSWRALATLVQTAEKENFELPVDVQTTLDGAYESMQKSAEENKYESVDALLVAEMGPSVTFDDYEYYLKLNYVGNHFFSQKANAQTANMEEIENYFKDNEDMLKNDLKITKDSGNVVSVRHILVKPTGGKTYNGETVYSDEEWATCEKVAKKILDEWLAGEATSESFAALANKHSEDRGSNSKGGLYEGVNKGDMVDAFDEWIFAEDRKTGDYGMVKTDFGWHVMYFEDTEAKWLYTCRNAVINMKCTELMASIMESYEYEADFKSVTMGEHVMSK